MKRIYYTKQIDTSSVFFELLRYTQSVSRIFLTSDTLIVRTETIFTVVRELSSISFDINRWSKSKKTKQFLEYIAATLPSHSSFSDF